jgi:hypothetical protein
MRFIRGRLLAVAATLAVVAVAAPISTASADWPFTVPNVDTAGGQAGSFGCGLNTPAGVGFAGSTTSQSCGSVLSFVGPAIGQVATVIGPTIIGATVVAPVTVSAGPVQN